MTWGGWADSVLAKRSSIEDLFASTESAHPPQLFDTTGMVRIALMFNIVGTFIFEQSTNAEDRTE